MCKIIISFITCLIVMCCINHPRPVEDTPVSVTLMEKGNGTITGFPDDSSVLKGDTLVLFAEADSAYRFSGWYIGSFVVENPLVLVVDTSIEIMAQFVLTPIEGVVYIPAGGAQFIMGSSSSAAPAIEQPAHTVEFSYDFFIGTHEVTIGEYRDCMEEVPTGVAADDDSLPVTFITWYDAIRYCNEMSKRAGYDTVYSYTAQCAVPGKCPYVLEHCTVHYDRFGYRLPTEAEWEFACHGGTKTAFYWGEETEGADTHTWFFDNADNMLHAVGEKEPNGYGLYDISGNAAEWVNDWLSFYTDSLYRNPVGPVHLTEEQLMETGERIIKGGSYRLSSSYLHPQMRKGPYEMTATAVQRDIGFRVALGAFTAPESAPEVVLTDSLNAWIVSNKSDLIECVGTHKIKVAFCYSILYNHYCAFVDFTESPVMLKQCSNDSSVVSPVISPDGACIAWGSKDEGHRTGSTISIRNLTGEFPLTDSFPGFFPRFWVDPETLDTFLIYTDGASSDNQVQWYMEKTYRCKVKAGVRQGTPEVLWAKGSYHGGLSSDGRFLGTAFPAAKLVDLQLNDTNIFYFVPPWNGRTDTPQVCNFSMSPSLAHPGEALFLDFGYSGISSLVGRSYDLHEIIFVANTLLFTKEHISGWFVVPDTFQQWNGSEYTNHPEMITSIAEPTSGDKADALFLIHAKDSSYLNVIEGMSLRTPAIWIDPTEVAEVEDPFRSFGMYDIPIMTAGQVALAKKLRLFWHERERVHCVAIGNSPMLYGFDPRHITTYPTLSVAWFSNSIGGSITVAQQYILPHTPNLELLIIDLDASYFSVDSRELPRLTGLYYTKGYQFDSSHQFYRTSLPEAVREKAAAFTADDWLGFDSTGAFLDSIIGDGWGDAIDEGYDYSLEDSIVMVNIALFKELLDSASARNIQVLAINFPQNPKYAETTMVGRAGPSHETYNALAQRMGEFMEEYPGFYFYDANNGGDHDYSEAEALDANHLNSRGGIKLANRIDSLLQVIVK